VSAGSCLCQRIRFEVRGSLDTLNDAPEIRPEAHVWVSERAPWFEISDALPQIARDGRDG
jgi:hypothetical protein